jgi:hypothetical protein
MDYVNENNPFKSQSNSSQINTTLTGKKKKSVMDCVNENNPFKSRSNSPQTDKESNTNPVKSNNTFKRAITENNL